MNETTEGQINQLYAGYIPGAELCRSFAALSTQQLREVEVAPHLSQRFVQGLTLAFNNDATAKTAGPDTPGGFWINCRNQIGTLLSSRDGLSMRDADLIAHSLLTEAAQQRRNAAQLQADYAFLKSGTLS